MTAAIDPIAELADKLRKLIVRGALTIAPETISPSSLGQLFKNFLQNRSLVIAGAQISIPSGLDFVQIFGMADNKCQPFSDMEVDGRVKWSGKQYELTLFGRSIDSLWTLGKGFEVLGPDEPLGLLQIESPQFVLSSAGDFSTPVGLSFSGNVPFVGMETAPLIGLFPGTDTVAVSGLVSVFDEVGPLFSFTGNGTNAVQLAGLFNITPALTLKYGPPPGGGAAQQQLYAAWDLQYDVSIPPLSIYARYPFDDPVLSFTADVSRSVGFIFGMLSRLTGGTNFGPLMPGQLPMPPDFGISSWTVGVNGEDLSLQSFMLQARTTQAWPIVSGISLDSLGFEFGIEPGFDSNSSFSLTLLLNALLFLDSDKRTALSLYAAFPDFAFGGELEGPGIDLHSLVARYSADAAHLLPENMLALTKLGLAINPSSSIYRFNAVAGSPASKWPINLGVAEFVLTQVTMDIGSAAGNVEAAGSARLALSNSVGAPTLEVAVEYKSTGGWSFGGEITNITYEQLLESVEKYFPALATILGALDLDIAVQKIAVEMRPTGTPRYRFVAQVVWTLDVGAGKEDSLQITGIVNLEVGDDGTQTGYISGAAKFKTLILTVKRELNDGGVTDFWWSDFHASWDPALKTATFDFGTLSMGSMVSTMVDAVVPGQSYSLIAPFDLLNTLTLTGVEVVLHFDTKIADVSIPTTLANFGFLDAEEFTFRIDWGKPQPPVTFAVSKGTFLGSPINQQNVVGWNVLDPASATRVPGFGNGLFSVEFLGIGQRFKPRAALDTTTVETALATLETAFLQPDHAANGLVYAPDANWILAIEAWIFHNSIWLGGLFLDDPELYGVAVKVMPGGRITQFANLHFEILYKKLTPDIGVYQAAITLPDNLRYLDFGSVGVTLPNFSIWIYTNGDFLIDFGFPRNNNFSVSFAVQMLPFLGAGGFYFGSLSGASASNLPRRTSSGAPIQGTFNPVITFGIGVAVGLGGSINYSVVRGGLSLLLTGVVEGVFATFNPFRRNPTYEDFYWSINGQVSIVGRLFGVIDFGIVVARFDATITVSIAAAMAAYRPVTFTFSASIVVSASVSINLGLFSITVGFSFDLTVSDSYTVGKVRRSPWDPDALDDPYVRRRLGCSLSDSVRGDLQPLRWAPVKSDERFTLWLVPHFASASEAEEGTLAPAKAQIIATTYIERAAAESTSEACSPFASLAQGVLLWLINAAVNGKEADKAAVQAMVLDYDQASGIFSSLSDAGSGAPFGLDALQEFLAAYGLFTLKQRSKWDNARDATVTVFPIIPLMTLRILDGPEIPFSSIGKTTGQALQGIRAELLEMQPAGPAASPGTLAGRYRTAPTSTVADDVSLSTFLFLDYFAIIAKGVAQGALNALKEPSATYEDQSLGEFAGTPARVRRIAKLNRTRQLRQGVVLTIPSTARILPGSPYAVGVGRAETLLGIARRFGTDAEELAVTNAGRALFSRGAPVTVPIGDAMTAGAIIDALQAKGVFDNIAGQVARVFLQGLRPPWPTAGGTPKALYAVSGQQFDASAMKTGQSYTIGAPGAPWVDASDGKVTLDEADHALISEMNDAFIAPVFATAVQPCRDSVAKRFTLAAPVLWTTDSAVRLANLQSQVSARDGPTLQTIWQFPADLAQLMAANPGLRPEVVLHEDTADAPHLMPYAVGEAADPLAFSWATTFTVSVSRIPSSADPTRELAGTYGLSGADTVGSAYLERLLREDHEDAVPVSQIYILFSLQPGTALPSAGVKSDPLEATSFFVMQTNLSTASNPPQGLAEPGERNRGVSPVGMTSIEMLRLIWECSAVRSGGYQLFYDHAKNGLPDFLFAQNGSAELTILVTYGYTDNCLRPFMNGLVVSQPVDHDSVIYLEAVARQTEMDTAPLLDRAATMTAGHVGFTALRSFSEPARWVAGSAMPEGAAAQLVEQQYQLLEYRIAGSSEFRQGPYGLPLSPVKPPAHLGPTQGSWFAAVLPIAQFARDPGADSGLPGQPSPADDPYRGIGKSVSIALGWHDIFGNVITTRVPADGNPYVVESPVLYFDDLVAVSAWPGIGLAYTIGLNEKGGAPTLSIVLTSDSARYNPDNPQIGAGAWLNVVAADLQKFASIYYQIARNVRITMASSLDLEASAIDVTQPLVVFVVQVYAYLSELFRSRVYVAKANSVTLSAGVADIGGEALFPLLASLTIRRTDFVDPACGRDSLAASVTTDVGPLFQPAGDPNAPGTLVEFAVQLQRAFPELKVGSCTPESVAGATELWLMRLGGAGYSCSFSAPHYFSLQPLAVTPLSLANIAVHGYDGTAALPGTPAVEKSFSNVDLDLLARDFFAAMDQFLSPDYVVNAWQIATSQALDVNPVKVILDAKRTLAKVVPAGLAPPYAVQATPDSAPFAAVVAEKLEQELLIRLSTAYQIDAIIAVLATVSSPDSDPQTAPRLYGKPVQTGATQASELYSLSAANVPLVGTLGASYLSFTFTTRDAPAAAIIEIPLAFDPTHLQFNLKPMPDPLAGHTASSWLSFITPFSPASAATPVDGSLGTLSIPIPLKAFPTPPALVSQTAEPYQAQDGKVATTRLWTYSFIYEYMGASQDDIHARIDFSLPDPPPANEVPNLPSMLVQFSSVWPAILADLNKFVLSPGTNDVQACVAMQSFAWLAQQIADLWPRSGPPLHDFRGNERSLEFTVTQAPVDVNSPDLADGVLQITTTPPDGFIPPIVDIDGYETRPEAGESGRYLYTSGDEPLVTYLDYRRALELPRRKVRMAPRDPAPSQVYDLLTRPQAWGAVSIARNEFYGLERGNPAFVYRTPYVRSVTASVPLLEPKVSLDMADYGPAPRVVPLLEYLSGFLTALLTPAEGGPAVPAMLQMSASFQYWIAKQAGLTVEVPILLLVPTLLEPGGAVVKDAATQISRWIIEHELQGTPGALKFSVALFSFSANPLPALKLDDIHLDAALVQWKDSQ